MIGIRLVDNKATFPTKATEGSSGYDLYSMEFYELDPGERKMFDIGIELELPKGFEGQVRSRSGLALKHGVVVHNSPGTVDSDYKGRVGVILHNAGEKTYLIGQGDRIAQLVFAPICTDQVIQIDETEPQYSARGSGGFGSTGV